MLDNSHSPEVGSMRAKPSNKRGVRELSEERGIALDASAIVGRLDDYPTRSGYLIAPIVSALPRVPS